MRLLDTISLALKEFLAHNIPPYATFSQTWNEDKISFQEMRGDRAPLERKVEFEKIKGACALAKKDGFLVRGSLCVDKYAL